MDEHPDSSLLVLENISFPESLPPEDYAFYCLLLTQAKDKNYLSLKGDTLIDKAVTFYETSGDSLRMAQSYFYRSRRDFQNQDMEQSMVSSLRSLECAGRTAPKSLLGLINNHLGVLHLEERNFNQAIKFFRRSIRHNSVVMDLEKEIFCLREIAKTYLLSNKMDSAIFYYKHAKDMVNEAKDSHLKSILLNDLAVLHQELGENDQAKQYLVNSIEIEKDSVRLGKRYLTLAELYLEENKPDSAWYYFDKSVRFGDVYTFATVLNQKYEWAKKTGNLAEALNYSDKLRQVKDSIAFNFHNVKITEAEQKFHYEKLKGEHISGELKHKILMNRVFLVLLGLTIFLILIIMAYCHVSRSKNKKIREQEEEMCKMRKKAQAIKNEIFTKTEIAKKIKTISLSNPNPRKILEAMGELMTNQEWDELVYRMDDTYDNFTNRLKKKYPELKEDDIRLCCLLKLERDIPDISLFLNINPDSVIKKKSRLKLDKMKLVKSVDFDKYLAEF